MSLDIYLRKKGAAVTAANEECIYIREAGQLKKIPRVEWNERYPDREPYTVRGDDPDLVYHGNITHNMTSMATEAGIYQALWRPEEVSISKTSQLQLMLAEPVLRMIEDPERFKKFDPDNGWGSYEVFLDFLDNLLRACEKWPDAEVSVWR